MMQRSPVNGSGWQLVHRCRRSRRWRRGWCAGGVRARATLRRWLRWQTRHGPIRNWPPVSHRRWRCWRATWPRAQAKVLKSYVEALCLGPSLSPLVVSINATTVQLATGARILILPTIGATVRGLTLAAAVCDEIAFWATDEASAYRDTDVLEALRPALADLPVLAVAARGCALGSVQPLPRRTG